jgi:hypothetical protein
VSTVSGHTHRWRLGKRVAAHAHGTQGIAQAVAARVDTIKYCSFAGPDRKYGSDFDPAVVDEIAAAGIYVCPAMNVHALTIRDRFGDALDKVIMGLYSGGAQILEAATLRAARALGVDDRSGTIEPGKDADLIAVRGDPRSDLSVLRHIELVVARGTEHRPAAPRVRAAELAAPAGPGPR